MSSLHKKRKWAGEPIKDKKKVVPEPPRVKAKPKPKVYVLKVIETTVTEYEWNHKYPTRVARDQAKAAFEKKIKSDAAARRQFKWYRRYVKDVKFEESEE
jgi:hypothetical protein